MAPICLLNRGCLILPSVLVSLQYFPGTQQWNWMSVWCILNLSSDESLNKKYLLHRHLYIFWFYSQNVLWVIWKVKAVRVVPACGVFLHLQALLVIRPASQCLWNPVCIVMMTLLSKSRNQDSFKWFGPAFRYKTLLALSFLPFVGQVHAPALVLPLNELSVFMHRGQSWAIQIFNKMFGSITKALQEIAPLIEFSALVFSYSYNLVIFCLTFLQQYFSLIRNISYISGDWLNLDKFESQMINTNHRSS